MSIICLVSPEVERALVHLLRDHYRDAGVEVIVDRRNGDRRSGADRRKKDKGPPTGRDDRRLVHNRPDSGGRRVAERRATLVAVDPPLSLPRKAEAHREASKIAFFERIEPTEESLEDVDTARLVIRLQSGERELFAKLYERYFDRIYAYCRVLVRDDHVAEDLTQQSFLEALEALPRYERREAPFRAWLFSVVRNNAVSYLRTHKRTEARAEVELDEVAEGGAPEEIPVLQWISDGDLMLFVERLPLAQRQVLMLRYMMGMSAAEIGEILGRSPEAVRMQQSRAIAFLRQRLSAVGRGPARRRTPALGMFRQATVLRLRRFALTAPGRTG